MRRLAVNADDFGNDENRTRAILESFRIGAITHTTALVNMPYFRDSAKMIAEAGFIEKMGIHLNLTEGRPMTGAMRQCRMFCNSSGEFNCEFHLDYRKRFHLPYKYDAIIRDELRAQIEEFIACGGVRMHADSHHHVHTDWSIARIAVPLLKEYGFTSMRKSRNAGIGLGLAKKLYKGFFNRYVSRRFQCEDFFCSFGDLKASLDSIPDGSSVEVMVHPMFGSPGRLDINGPLTDSGFPILDELGFYKDNSQRIAFHD